MVKLDAKRFLSVFLLVTAFHTCLFAEITFPMNGLKPAPVIPSAGSDSFIYGLETYSYGPSTPEPVPEKQPVVEDEKPVYADTKKSVHTEERVQSVESARPSGIVQPAQTTVASHQKNAELPVEVIQPAEIAQPTKTGVASQPKSVQPVRALVPVRTEIPEEFIEPDQNETTAAPVQPEVASPSTVPKASSVAYTDTRGLDAYRNKDYASAAVLLRKAIADSGDAGADMHYMLVMSDMYSGDYAAAVNDADALVSSYPDSSVAQAAVYQKGRALHYSGNNDDSVMVLSDFCHDNPESPMYASALYWIGEDFYDDYSFDTAGSFYERIVDEFPDDSKVPDARYKLENIAQRKREQKLLALLKQRDENSLEMQEDYEKQLKNYETEDIIHLKKQLADANKRIAELQAELDAISKAEAAEKAAQAVAPVPVSVPSAESVQSVAQSPAPSVANSQPKPMTVAAPDASPVSPSSESAASVYARRRGIREEELLELKAKAASLQKMLDEKYDTSAR